VTITELAPAKINLALHVRRRRDDGYHEIETLFAFLRDGDTVSVAAAEADSFSVTGPFAGALVGESDNLVLAAREAFAEAFGPVPPLAITLDKHLPVASGIGGGSADAAATLRALARLAGVDAAALTHIALALGSDVPACLLGKSAVGGGRGEQLEEIVGLAGMPVLLVNPDVAVSTGAVFSAWDGVDRGPLINAGMTDWLPVALTGRNDLETPALGLAPVIGEVLNLLNDQPGVTLARMSGSGATCFALFADDVARSSAHTAIAAARPGWWCLESALT
jgi:4-diphosphocytidyl-2-C-methyl-D-erythritol kinase